LDRDLLEKNYKKVNDQLFNIGCRKSKIKKQIYSLYDSYLTIVRSKLQNYIGEAIKANFIMASDEISVEDQKVILFIKKDLRNIVNDILPFLTIEQLSIKKEYKIANPIKNYKDLDNNYNPKEEVSVINNFQITDTNYLTNYCTFYYKNLINEDDSININVDNYVLKNKYFDSYKHHENLGYINSTILLKDFDEDKLSLNIYQSKEDNYFIPIEFNDIILWIDTLESSLNLYLQDLSIKINNALFNKSIINRFINNDLLLYVFDNHILFNNPSPFLLTFDPSQTQYINFDENFREAKFSKINLININSAELEFININLSILKNKLLDLKSNIYLLIKKENYWCNKLKLNSNILSNINKL